MFQKCIFDKMQNRNCLVLYDRSLMDDQALIYNYLTTINKTVDSMSPHPSELYDPLTYPLLFQCVHVLELSWKFLIQALKET